MHHRRTVLRLVLPTALVAIVLSGCDRETHVGNQNQATQAALKSISV